MRAPLLLSLGLLTALFAVPAPSAAQGPPPIGGCEVPDDDNTCFFDCYPGLLEVEAEAAFGTDVASIIGVCPGGTAECEQRLRCTDAAPQTDHGTGVCTLRGGIRGACWITGVPPQPPCQTYAELDLTAAGLGTYYVTTDPAVYEETNGRQGLQCWPGCDDPEDESTCYDADTRIL